MVHNASFGDGVVSAFTAGDEAFDKKTAEELDQKKRKKDIEKAVEQAQAQEE